MDAGHLAGLLGLWHERRRPLKHALATAIAEQIDAGALHDGDVLPPDRLLAGALAVSRGTVVNAYETLRESGIVERRQGSGTIVRSAASPIADAELLSRHLFPGPSNSVNLLKACPDLLPLARPIVGTVDFDAAGGDVDSIEPAGLPAARERIAELLTADGVATAPSQVMVSSGAQQALYLVCATFIRPGDIVLTEATTWPGLVDSIAVHGGRAVGVEVDDDGIVPAELEAAIQRMRPVFIAVNPHHHNPTGTRLRTDRRRIVAELAASYHVPLVEDRVTARLAFDGDVPPPLAAASGGDLDITIDSFCKVVWPGLRLGWLRANAATVERLRQRRAIIDLAPSVTDQLSTMAIADHLDELLPARVEQLRRRADTLLAALAAQLPDWSVRRPRGGLITWIELPDGGAAAFCEHVGRFGVQLASGRQFAVGGDDDRHIRLPFTAAEPELLTGVGRLARAWTTFEPPVLPPRPATLAG